MNYQINTEKILFTELGEEGVVYSMENNEYASLNETFYKILKGVEQGKTQTDIVTDLRREYNISEADCTQEVADALQLLEENGYLIQG